LKVLWRVLRALVALHLVSNSTPSRENPSQSYSRKDTAKCEKRMPRIISALSVGEAATQPSATVAIYDRSVKFWREFISGPRPRIIVKKWASFDGQYKHNFGAPTGIIPIILLYCTMHEKHSGANYSWRICT